MTINDIIADLARATFIATIDLDDALSITDELLDNLLACIDQIDDINRLAIMHLAHMIDPTDSNIAAEIRDLFRDNIDD